MEMPKILYGTAWKKDQTADLVALAFKCGFRGLDTAAQPKHYNEPGVGEGLRRAFEELSLQRSEVFVQTKFSPLMAQDPSSVPYDQNAPLEDQVHQSLAVSQKNLDTSFIDSWVLHSPFSTLEETMTVWRAMESHVQKNSVGQIGISNCYDLRFFEALYEAAEIKPRVLQNRFFEQTDYDRELRRFCRNNQVTYQSFWTLTANPHLLEDPKIREVAKKNAKTPAQILFRHLMDLEITPLTGTTSEAHMREDLEILQFELSASDRECLEKFAF